MAGIGALRAIFSGEEDRLEETSEKVSRFFVLENHRLRRLPVNGDSTIADVVGISSRNR